MVRNESESKERPRKNEKRR